MKRDIIKIDEEKCTGCGVCVPNCHEGALQVIDGKVRLISELMCDGLGACIGHCPEGAITIEQREAEPYNETAVIAQMVSGGANTVTAHLKHLKEHNETGYLKEAVTWLKENRENIRFNVDGVIEKVHSHGVTFPGVDHHAGIDNHTSGCPGSRERIIAASAAVPENSGEEIFSELRQWPVQMHLINPASQSYRDSDLLLAADCVAYSLGSFHKKYLRGKTLAIACPKLDHGSDIYIKKLVTLIDEAKINTVTVMIMEVPCCSGLIQMVRKALDQAERKVPVKLIMVSIQGTILQDVWI